MKRYPVCKSEGEASDLKPCPHCGSADVSLWIISGGGRKVMCGSCDDYHNTDEKAIESWNNRPLENELVEALERLVTVTENLLSEIDLIPYKTALSKAKGEE